MYHMLVLPLLLLAGTPHAEVRNDTNAWLRVSSLGENIVHCIAPRTRFGFSGGALKTLFFEFMSEADCRGTRIEYATRVGPGGGVIGSYTAYGTAPHYRVDSASSGGAVM